MRNIAFKVIDRLFVVAYGPADPTDDEWHGFVEDVKRHGVDRTMFLIFTEGGGPSAPQRRYLEDVLAGRVVPVAVMSASPSIALMVRAMSWANSKIRYFSRTGLYDALAHLEVPGSRADLIERELAKLRGLVRRSEK